VPDVLEGWEKTNGGTARKMPEAKPTGAVFINAGERYPPTKPENPGTLLFCRNGLRRLYRGGSTRKESLKA